MDCRVHNRQMSSSEQVQTQFTEVKLLQPEAMALQHI